MKKIITDLLPVALQCGVSIFDFYNMTLLEVQQVIQAYEEKEKLSLKQSASMAYAEAQLISIFINSLFSKTKPELPTLYQIFPELFKEEIAKEEAEREAKATQALKEWAERVNKMRGEQNGL